MIRVIRLLVSSIALATSAAATGFALSGVWLGILFAVFWLGFWSASLVRQYRSTGAGVGSSALFGYAVITIYAVASGVWPGWLLLGLVAALAAWDLECFILRMRDVQDENLVTIMIKQHVGRLAVVAGLGLLLPGAAFFIHYDLKFGAALVIGFLAVLGVSRFIILLRRSRA